MKNLFEINAIFIVLICINSKIHIMIKKYKKVGKKVGYIKNYYYICIVKLKTHKNMKKIFFIEQFMFIKTTLAQLTKQRGAIVSVRQERNDKGCIKVYVPMKLLEEEVTGLMELFHNRFKQTLVLNVINNEIVFTIK